MRLTHMLTNEIVIARLSDLGDDKQAFSTVTSTKGTIQPLEDENSQIADGVFGKTFAFYSDGNVTLLPGDRLRDSDNNFYTVKSGAATVRQHGRMTFQKIVIELTR